SSLQSSEPVCHGRNRCATSRVQPGTAGSAWAWWPGLKTRGRSGAWGVVRADDIGDWVNVPDDLSAGFEVFGPFGGESGFVGGAVIVFATDFGGKRRWALDEPHVVVGSGAGKVRG